jgi:outer membrane protein assembly factor BamB
LILVARLVVALLFVVACGTQPPASLSAQSPASPTAGGPAAWKTEAILDFPNQGVGDLELIAGNLITLSGQGTTVTGTDIIAIDPGTGRTRWTDTALTDLVPAGDRAFHSAHYLRDGDDIIALVADGSLQKSAVIRFSAPARQLMWQFAVNGVIFPESLSVHNSVTCFVVQGPPTQPFARSITCLAKSGKSLWTRNLAQSDGDSVEVEIAATKLMVLSRQGIFSAQAMVSAFDLQTGSSIGVPFQVDARFGDIGIRHLAGWKDDKVLAFLTEGIAVVDLSSSQPQPQIVLSLAGQFPRVPEIDQGGSIVYIKYDLPYPKGGDQPMADVVAAFDLDRGTKLWERTDTADPQFERMRPMRLQGPDLLYGDDNGGVWVLTASTGAVERHYVPSQDPLLFLDTVAPLRYGSAVIISENFGPGPLDYRLTAIP